MRFPVTDEERRRGVVTVTMLPEQLEVLDELLRARGFEFSPPMPMGGESKERFIVLTEARAKSSATFSDRLRQLRGRDKPLHEQIEEYAKHLDYGSER